MKKKLTLTLIQTNIFWHQREKNLSLLENRLKTIAKSDLIILPEMFTSGFTLEPDKVYDTPQGETFSIIRKYAAEYETAISGSIVIKDNNKFFNRFFFLSGNGKEFFYDKRHLFTMAGEDRKYSAGNKRVVFDYHGWKIKPLICYDLRFPVWARNTEGYHLLIYVANWPESRIAQWQSLLVARAIENQSYVVAVNRIGEDGNGFVYSGRSMVVSPKGEIIYLAPDYNEDIHTVEIDLDYLLEGRKKFPVLNDADEFVITNL